jgi:hypothetical protein
MAQAHITRRLYWPEKIHFTKKKRRERIQTGTNYGIIKMMIFLKQGYFWAADDEEGWGNGRYLLMSNGHKIAFY